MQFNRQVNSEHTKCVRFTLSVLILYTLNLIIDDMIHGGRHLAETGSSKIIARLITIHGLLSNFTMQNNCFMVALWRKRTFNNFTLQQFAILLKICVKKM